MYVATEAVMIEVSLSSPFITMFTALFTFEAGAARLVRGGDGQDQEDDEPELEDEECRWRLLIASNKKQADSGDED